jgi:hypothetical protein
MARRILAVTGRPAAPGGSVTRRVTRLSQVWSNRVKWIVEHTGLSLPTMRRLIRFYHDVSEGEPVTRAADSTE